MLKVLLSYLLYAGASPADIRQVKGLLAKRNQMALNFFSLFSAVVYGGLALVNGNNTNLVSSVEKSFCYQVGFLCMVVVFVLNTFVTPKCKGILPWLICAFELVLYVVGIQLAHNQPVMTLFIMVAVVPPLFVEKPYKALLLLLIANAVFLYYCVLGGDKTIEEKEFDMFHMVLFSIIGFVVCVYTTKVGLERFIFEHRVTLLNDKELQVKYLSAVSSIYVSMHQFDLETDTFVQVRSNNFIDKSLESRNEHFSKQVNLAMQATTDPDYLEDILKFVDISTLADRIRGKRTITHEFLGKNFGWCRARFISDEVDPNSNPRFLMFVVESINEQKNREKALTTMAETDALTDLLNRRAGSATIKARLENGQKGMLCMFDIDKFKHANDEYGHQAGDEVIKAVADAMRKAFRDVDVLMRLGGDEFIVFVNGVVSEEIASVVIYRFFKTLEECRIESIPGYNISISLGAAFTKPGDTFDVLYKQADECTYQSKKVEGKSFTFYRG